MANEFSLDSFVTNFGQNGGARPYLFRWSPQLSVGNAQSAIYMARATSLPESNIEEIQIHWQGMANKLTGARTYADWTITLLCDENWQIRTDFETWLSKINSYEGGGNFASKRSDYVTTQRLELLDYDLNPTKTVILNDAWPKAVGAITLDYSSQDIAQFDITFAYNYFTIG